MCSSALQEQLLPLWQSRGYAPFYDLVLEDIASLLYSISQISQQPTHIQEKGTETPLLMDVRELAAVF